MGDFSGRFTDGAAARDFALAGRARLTLVSEVTGKRFTFSVRRGTRNDGAFTVGVLRGPENEADYGYLGVLVLERAWVDRREVELFVFRRTARSLSAEAPSVKVWAWAWAHLAAGNLPPRCAAWHKGKCGKCGRPLTVPESVATGMGPKCAAARRAA